MAMTRTTGMTIKADDHRGVGGMSHNVARPPLNHSRSRSPPRMFDSAQMLDVAQTKLQATEWSAQKVPDKEETR